MATNTKTLGFKKDERGDYTSPLFPGFRIIGQCGENRSGGKATVHQYYLEKPSYFVPKMRKLYPTLKSVYEALNDAQV